MSFDQTRALGTRRDELTELYTSTSAGTRPVGRSVGTVLFAPGGALAQPINTIARVFWRGKAFHPNGQELQNLLSPAAFSAIRARVYEAPSLLDGKPCHVLDYSTTSWVARLIRDEIREVSPQNYLGLVFVSGRRVPVDFWLNFDPPDADQNASVPRRAFRLEERSADWALTAPIRIERELFLPVTPDEAFATLADHLHWPDWFGGMRRVRVDGPASGVGALRTVWVGAARVQEQFIRWEEGRRLTFSILESSLPGLRAMQEDWRLSVAGDKTRLSITIGAEAQGFLQKAPNVVEAIVARSTKGASGIVSAFGPRLSVLNSDKSQ